MKKVPYYIVFGMGILAGALLRGVIWPQQEVSVTHYKSEAHSTDTSVYARPKQVEAQIPVAKSLGAVAASVNRYGSGRDTVSRDSLPIIAPNDTTVFVNVLVPRPDTLKNGKFAQDTLSFKVYRDNVCCVEIKHAPLLVHYLDTLYIYKDSLKVTDSVVVRGLPAFSVFLKSSLRFPSTSIGSFLTYGFEASILKNEWEFSIEPFVYLLKAGIAFNVKYHLF